MAEYIDRELAKEKHCNWCQETHVCYRKDNCPERKTFDLIPAADVVPRQLYEQACAVRDIAVEQLRQIGKDVGDAMDDVRVEARREARIDG